MLVIRMFLKSTNQILMVISEICNSPMFAVSKIIVYMNLDYLSRYMMPYQNKMNCQLMLIYDMKPVTKYQISAINSCWEKCDEKWAYMFNVYKNQLSRQTGSRNLTGSKTLPKIWYTYMTLVTKYQISAINSYWEKCDEKYLGRTDGQR
jgi:hypothetical protein